MLVFLAVFRDRWAIRDGMVGHPVLGEDRRSVAVACIAQHYRITVSLDQRGRGFGQKTENVMARLVLVTAQSGWSVYELHVGVDSPAQ